MRNQFVIHSIAITLALSCIAWFWPPILWAFIILGPLILMGVYDMFQAKHAIKRNFPLLGRGRYLLENMGPKVNQYFIESEPKDGLFTENSDLLFTSGRNESWTRKPLAHRWTFIKKDTSGWSTPFTL